MAVIREQDLGKGRAAFEQWQDAAHNIFSEQLPADDDAAFDFRLNFSPRLPRQLWAMAVRYSLYLLEKKAPGEGVEVRVAPWGAIKILDGPASDPHNLTPPDVIELDPDVWMRLATGITSWDEEKDAGAHHRRRRTRRSEQAAAAGIGIGRGAARPAMVGGTSTTIARQSQSK